MGKLCGTILTPESIKESFEVLEKMPSIRYEYNCKGDMYYYQDNILMGIQRKGQEYKPLKLKDV